MTDGQSVCIFLILVVMQKKIMHKQPCVIGCSVTVGKGKEKEEGSG